MSYILIYDGSLAGLLTCIFEVYERKLQPVQIRKQADNPDIFATIMGVATDASKAKRVWTGLKKRLPRENLDQFYNCYLSELPGIEDTMLDYARYCFDTAKYIGDDYGHRSVLKVAQTARTVWREKHRMEAFVRFQLGNDGLFYAGIGPDHDVLPLIMPHFKSRYADQNWLIYDLKRKYGIHYNKETYKVSLVTIEISEDVLQSKAEIGIFDPQEAFYQQLWKDYFKHTGIPERKNLKLHIKHIPLRYWKYLPEKQ